MKLRRRDAISHDARTGLNMYLAILEQGSAQHDARVDVSIVAKISESAGVESALNRFLFGDNLHSPHFGGPGNGPGGEGCPHQIVGGFTFRNLALHLGDNVHHVGVAFDHVSLWDVNAAVFADSADVVAR